MSLNRKCHQEENDVKNRDGLEEKHRHTRTETTISFKGAKGLGGNEEKSYCAMGK